MKRCPKETRRAYFIRWCKGRGKWWRENKEDIQESIGNACVLTFRILGIGLAGFIIGCVVALIIITGWVAISITLAIAIVIFMIWAAVEWSW